MKNNLVRAALLLTVLALAGCVRQIPSINYYQLAGPERGTPNLPPVPYTIAVPDFECSAALRNQELAYIPRPLAIGYYSYHQWVAPPARILSERVRNELMACGLFKRVSGQSVDADYVILGFVSGFHEEDGPTVYGVLSVDIELQNSSYDTLWHKFYQYRIPVPERTPSGQVAALNEAAAKLCKDLLADVSATLP